MMVPRDIAIVASDDADLCLSCEPTLTSILPSMEVLGIEMIRLLVGILQKPEKQSRTVRLAEIEMVVRESTGQRRPACDVAAALEYIQVNATRGINVAQIIKETQRVSKPTFHTYFREATGRSPAQAIRDRQLQEVRRLLTDTNLPMETISDLCGFSGRAVMTRLFNSVEFMSPRKYRQRHNRMNGN